MHQGVSCPHDIGDSARRLCAHLVEHRHQESVARFTGSGLDYELLCLECAAAPEGAAISMRSICAACFSDFDYWQEYWSDVIGLPRIPEKASTLRFVHEVVALPGLANEGLADLRPVDTATARRWIALTTTGRIISIDLSAGDTAVLGQLPADLLGGASRPTLHLSFDASLAAAFDAYGEMGAVVNLADGTVTMPLRRDDYCSAITYFPVAFAVLNGRTILIHATAWNRLEISDPLTGALLTERASTAWRRGETCPPPHYNGTFWGRLCVSPDQERILSSAWGWHPFGFIEIWNLRRWLEENVWEPDDGPSKVCPSWRENYWDDPVCWIDEKTLAVWGFGPHRAPMPAVRIFDIVSGRLARWFPGPDIAAREASAPVHDKDRGAAKWAKYVLEPYPLLMFDQFLFSISKLKGTSVWDIATGERLMQDGTCMPDRYHPGAKEFLTALPEWSFRVSRLSGIPLSKGTAT